MPATRRFTNRDNIPLAEQLHLGYTAENEE
jgi:hypothetical protein